MVAPIASLCLAASARSSLALAGCTPATARSVTATATILPRCQLSQEPVTQMQIRTRHFRGTDKWVTPNKPWKCASPRPIHQPYRGHYYGQRSPREHLQLPIPAETPVWDVSKMRTGLLARKAGMVSLYDHWGAQVPCTVLKVDGCQVVFNQAIQRPHGIQHSIQVGCTDVSGVNSKHKLGHFKMAGVSVKKSLAQFVVSPDAHIPVGTQLGATHFIPGQLVKLKGRTKDKGMQGVMKRHGFKGGPATHGSSKFHRKRGSTGASGPGRVLPGTKMPGHMGDEMKARVTVVVKVDAYHNLIYVKGNVFGPVGGAIRVSDPPPKPDVRKRVFPAGAVPPYPTITAEEYRMLGLPREVQMATLTKDPFNREGMH